MCQFIIRLTVVRRWERFIDSASVDLAERPLDCASYSDARRSELDAANAAYTPSPDEVARARKISTAFDAPENMSKGVVQLDGQMVERLHVEMAKRTIAIAGSIAAMKAD